MGNRSFVTGGMKVTVHVTPCMPRILFCRPASPERRDLLSGVMYERGDPSVDLEGRIAYPGDAEPPGRLGEHDGPSDPLGIDHDTHRTRVFATSVDPFFTTVVLPYVRDVIDLSG
jgi:hypothetical protein